MLCDPCDGRGKTTGDQIACFHISQDKQGCCSQDCKKNQRFKQIHFLHNKSQEVVCKYQQYHREQPRQRKSTLRTRKDRLQRKGQQDQQGHEIEQAKG